MPALGAGRKFFDVPPHFFLVPPPPHEGAQRLFVRAKVMGPSTYSYTHTHSISSAPNYRKAMGALQVK